MAPMRRAIPKLSKRPASFRVTLMAITLTARIATISIAFPFLIASVVPQFEHVARFSNTRHIEIVFLHVGQRFFMAQMQTMHCGFFGLHAQRFAFFYPERLLIDIARRKKNRTKSDQQSAKLEQVSLFAYFKPADAPQSAQSSLCSYRPIDQSARPS